jgi:endogenous inhibitor of DNA gyrase (YacG/DUF329 family)
MSPSHKPLLVNCPTCQKPTEWSTDNPFRPFCCERCKLIDIGKWANEEYVVPVSDAPPDDFQPTLH